MRVLFDGDVFVEYGQCFVWGPDWWGVLQLSFGDQANGLLGTAAPGGLVMIIGTHTGEVRLTVELHHTAPPVDDRWEDVVEATWAPHPDGRTDYRVTELNLGGGGPVPVEIPAVAHRVRYCASGMDAGHDGGRCGEGSAPDRYLLQLWPDVEPRPDVVVRLTSGTAEYWHGVVRDRPPLAEMVAERAERAERARVEREREEVEARARIERFHEHLAWGTPRPDPPLGDIAEGAAVARLDRPLAEALASAGPERQREIVRWLLGRGITEAGLDGIEWLTETAETVANGGPPSVLFTERHGTGAIDRLFADERITRTRVWSMTGNTDEYSGQIGALCAVRIAARDDPADVVFGVLGEIATTFGGDRYPDLFAELRRQFPFLDRT